MADDGLCWRLQKRSDTSLCHLSSYGIIYDGTCCCFRKTFFRAAESIYTLWGTSRGGIYVYVVASVVVGNSLVVVVVVVVVLGA